MKQATIHDDNHGIYHPFMLHEHELGLIVKSLEMLSCNSNSPFLNFLSNNVFAQKSDILILGSAAMYTSRSIPLILQNNI